MYIIKFSHVLTLTLLTIIFHAENQWLSQSGFSLLNQPSELVCKEMFFLTANAAGCILAGLTQKTLVMVKV